MCDQKVPIFLFSESMKHCTLAMMLFALSFAGLTLEEQNTATDYMMLSSRSTTMSA
jgi:hypothetical protein